MTPEKRRIAYAQAMNAFIWSDEPIPIVYWNAFKHVDKDIDCGALFDGLCMHFTECKSMTEYEALSKLPESNTHDMDLHIYHRFYEFLISLNDMDKCPDGMDPKVFAHGANEDLPGQFAILVYLQGGSCRGNIRRLIEIDDETVDELNKVMDGGSDNDADG
jgi:hypothetical protein